jgi:hypothetical protein
LSNSLRMFALFPGKRPDDPRSKALWHCKYIRALRSWIDPDAYAWWVFTDDLKAQQRQLLELRRR